MPLNHREILFNAADIATRRLADSQADVRTIALQMRMSARLVLKEMRSRQPVPKMKLVNARQS